VSAGLASAGAASLGAHPLLIACATIVVASVVHVVPPFVEALSEWSVARLRANAKAHGVEMKPLETADDVPRASGIEDSDRKVS